MRKIRTCSRASGRAGGRAGFMKEGIMVFGEFASLTQL